MPQTQSINHDGTQTNSTFDHLPDECPHCHHGIQPKQIGAAQIAATSLYLPLRCPRDSCSRSFFAIYEFAATGVHMLKRLQPVTPKPVDRSENIAAASAEFYKIYDQAHSAEQYGLSEVAGPGYRKALEFLIKDYASREFREALEAAKVSSDATAAATAQSEIDKVRGMALANVIANRVPDDDIKEMANRAAWIGNDETHYTRLWEGHDLVDLKQLLSLVLGFVDRKESARRYVAQMPKP
jgi:hypothetical protein